MFYHSLLHLIYTYVVVTLIYCQITLGYIYNFQRLQNQPLQNFHCDN